jgi:hypothetical protein
VVGIINDGVKLMIFVAEDSLQMKNDGHELNGWRRIDGVDEVEGRTQEMHHPAGVNGVDSRKRPE